MMPTYRTILVATDLSEPAARAARHGGELARSLGSRLVVLFAIEDRLPPLAAERGKISYEHRKKADAALAAWCEKELPGLAVERSVVEGVPHAVILDEARSIGAELIVVGMQGHNYLTHALVGSTAERVLHGAPCPVLVVGRDPSGG
jgi:nucleotide-binding universal stress UspA family protein